MTRKYGTYAGEFPGILLIVPDGVWHPVSRRQEMSQTPSVGAEPVEGWIFDDIARTFVLNDGVCRFFEENDPYTLEDVGRRIFEVAPGC